MKEEDLKINRKCHVIYSNECKDAILRALAKHYPEDKIEEVFTKVQEQYVSYLNGFRTDLGGPKNMHNGIGGTYDCIMMFSFYAVCKDVTSIKEVEEIYQNVFLPSFEKLSFVNINYPIMKRLLHHAFVIAAKKCQRWNDYKMVVEPYEKGKPIRYKFTECPVAKFAQEHDMLDVLPALCNVDYPSLECLNAKLIRTTTLGFGNECDYTIVSDRDPYIKEHEEYRDEKGYRRNH